MSELTKRSRWIVPLLLLLVLSVAFNLYSVLGHKGTGSSTSASASKEMYVCPMHPSIVQDHPGDCPICGMKLVPMKNGQNPAQAAPGMAPPPPAAKPAVPDSTTVTQTKTVYTCPMDPQVVEDHPGKCPICGMNLEKTTKTIKVNQAVARKVAYYRSPMDPKITSPVPRKDDMGMDYIAVYEDELNTDGNTISDRAEVSIDPARQQLIGLKTAPAVQSDIRGGWSTVGQVQADPTRVARINVKVSGYVERVFVDFVGKPVHRGEPLFSFYSPEIYGAEQEYLLALKSSAALIARGGAKEDGAALVNAVRQKLTLWDVPDEELKHLEDSREASKTVTFHSPVSGVVTAKDVVEGASLMPGATPYEITDLSSVWVLADAYQSDLDRVKVGMSATLKTQDRDYTGKVAFIDPVLNPDSRTLKVRINVPNPKGDLKPDLFGQVTLQGENHRALTIPADAVIPSGSRSMVFVSTGDGRFQPREVKLGARSGDLVEVRAGLAEGESVVTRANFLIDSESSLRAALSAMQGS
ncbi:MAG TPA: efflux RND transporter periplasmic adaptor subunit [bacterium]|jgi:Cu(I)/Ag(I) efflux system membrane fusion protein